MERPLTPKQQAFIVEYVKDYNGKEAAIRAGYSPKTAAITATKLLANDNVSKHLVSTSKQAVASITVDLITDGLAKIALDENESTRDRIRAYELLGKHLQMFTERLHIDTSNAKQLTDTERNQRIHALLNHARKEKSRTINGEAKLLNVES